MIRGIRLCCLIWLSSSLLSLQKPRTLAKGICVLQKSNYLRSLFVKMGQASFLLMGTHFMIIRGIDRIYAGYHQDISMMYEHYLGNHNMLIPLYLVLGIGLPLLLQAFWNRLSKGVAK